jgi:hypothetical protein
MAGELHEEWYGPVALPAMADTLRCGAPTSVALLQ